VTCRPGDEPRTGDRRLHLARPARAAGPDGATDRGERRGCRLHPAGGDGPSVADRPRRGRGARDARGLHDPRLPRRMYLAGRASRTRNGGRIPGTRAAGEGDDDPRRARRGAGDARDRQRRRVQRFRGHRSRPALPARRRRFERLEEALQICLQMWNGAQGPYEGRHYRLARTLNSPQSVRRPHPPILVGGAGEKKTLRLVARYADACNLFDGPELPHKLGVLRAHCEAIGRDYNEIEKTVVSHMDPGRAESTSTDCSRTSRSSATSGSTTRSARSEAPSTSVRSSSWASSSSLSPGDSHQTASHSINTRSRKVRANHVRRNH
jgi:hypothetical protein